MPNWDRLSVSVHKERTGVPIICLAFGKYYKSGAFKVQSHSAPKTDEIIRAVALYLKLKIDQRNKKDKTGKVKHYYGLEFQDKSLEGYKLFFVEPGYDVNVTIGSGVEERIKRNQHEAQMAQENSE